jgi:hypothetical protein
MKKISFTFILSILFGCLLFSANPPVEDNTSFTIIKSKQTLKFYITDDRLFAELNTVEKVRCNSKTGGTYQKAVYFDNSSEIVKINVNNRSGKYVITNDFPTDEIFHSDSKMAYVQHIFTQKSVEAEFQTTKLYKDFKLIDLLKFQHHNYEVLVSEIEIEIPSWLECEIKKFNFDQSKISETTTNNKGDITYLYKYSNIPARKSYKAEPDYRKYTPHIILLPAYMTHKDKKLMLLPDISHLYQWYNGLTKKTGNDVSQLKPLVESLIKDKNSNEEKIKAIYYYVQDHIKYIAFEHGIMAFKPESCQNVLHNKFGDCKGMANLTKEMLILAGIDARLTWLGTAGIPYNYDLPSLYADNHMICTVVDGDKYLFLDPTEKNNDLGDYADRIQGREVLIQNGDEYIRTVIPKQQSDKHEISEYVQLTLENDVLAGKGSMMFKGNQKSELVSLLQAVSEKERTEAIEKYIGGRNKNILLKVSKSEMPLRDLDHVIDFMIKIDNQIINDTKEKYISMEYENILASLTPEKERNIPFKINQRFYKNYKAELILPEGYSIKYLPKKYEVSNVLGDFSFHYKQSGNKILYEKKIHIREMEIEPEHFENWNTFMSGLKNFYNEQIILEKQ